MFVRLSLVGKFVCKNSERNDRIFYQSAGYFTSEIHKKADSADVVLNPKKE
jgi:hypothetical protein